MAFHKGKSFLAPPRPFKGDVSLYFPNLHGRTLLKDKTPRDTTNALIGKTSIVTMYSNLWAENQTKTFIDPKENPALHDLLAESDGKAQIVRVNMEENWMRAALIRLFMGNLRRLLGEENWGKYFLVRKPVTDEIRESIGLLNAKVGYVYLVDKDCRIRWAGSGNSESHERHGLVTATRRLVTEMGDKIR
jgi:ATPase complex subunit ATP10